MTCPCKRSGPFVPTIEQVADAAKKLPNPTRHSPYVLHVGVPVHVMHFRWRIHDEYVACQCTVPVLQFELRANVDEYGAVLYGWMYSGGVRV